ncbi:uncharacterized protein A4U43_C07F32270 [Asparagus officinalis]|uniref:Response regulatory domain-containing protein n=1 Tax=Asparagus officinalis TaxID=4686 RepID=A0A5P1EGG1_ASPOF|nr:uncharacterized protein A4U43_C07F32270 [Asparagus officinalis]
MSDAYNGYNGLRISDAYNFKILVAVSDGQKAWEIVRERPDSIDVVLAEVEVLLILGTNLLSMIMDHEGCKHIPVIMMSSNDSVNIVFNCMLKGAADFLVKHVRKNELRNLWQHVWRRQTLNDGIGNKGVHQDDNAMKTFEANPRKAKQLVVDQYLQCISIKKTVRKGVMPKRVILDTATQKQLINLISTIDNQQGCSYEPRENSAKNDNLYYTQEVVSCDEEFSCSPDSTPLLDLSLSRYNHSHVEKKEKNECRILNHSSSSAFSLYDSRIPVSTFLETGNLETQFENVSQLKPGPLVIVKVVGQLLTTVTDGAFTEDLDAM